MTATPETLFSDWAALHMPSETMRWQGAALRQFREIAHTAHDYGEPTVPATHRSKSIELPVVRFRCRERGAVLVRDNFYDLNVCVQWTFPPALTHGDVYGQPLTWAWYLAEIERCRGYSGGLKGDIDPLADPSWYWTQWSHDRLFFDGPMADGVRIYRAEHCFLQGIDEVVSGEATELWQPGRSAFTVSVPSWDRARILLHKLWGSWPPKTEATP